MVVWLLLLLAPPCHSEVTFTRDILPVLQKHCQVCHRPGEIGPMPLLTYKQVRPWAKAIREAVQLRKMPPWFAGPHFGEFANDPSLPPEDVAKVKRWVEEGSMEGDPKDAPAQPHWPSGWTAREPDVVIAMPRPFPIPADAVIEYQYIILPTRFQTDRWVRLVEIRPGDAGVVHHAVLYVREAESKWLRGVPAGVMYAPPASDTQALREARETKADILGVYTPGSPVSSWPDGMAKRVPAGADLILQLHYTARKTASSDQTRIGLVFAGKPVTKRVLTLQMGVDDIVIPPGDRECRLSRWGTLPREALLLSMLPHMHLRGSGFEYQIVHPRGRIETLLKVSHYDFHWQLSYRLKTPRLLPAGTRMLVTGIFDNSAGNPRNPDPRVEVHWGEQSWEEMMIGFFDVAVPPRMDKQSFFVRERN
ncbi:MAG: cytochrome c [Bryobacterales bacterium]|nr:cytochrome c [Bryobacterales bacterium]